MKSRAPLAIVAVVALGAVAAMLWIHYAPGSGVVIEGTADALPRADAAGEMIVPDALQAAAMAAQDRGVKALLVHRRGHRVFEYFATGEDSRRVEGGALAAAVLALTLTEPGQSDSVDAVQVARLVRERVWLPLRAGHAQLRLDTAIAPRRCCIEAQLDDWLRVGDLLLGQGAYRGERILTPDAVRLWLAAQSPAPWTGDEPLLAQQALWFDLQPGVRLWLAPRRQLAILVQGDEDVARDTRIPNIILRGLNDASPAVGSGIGDIVPGH